MCLRILLCSILVLALGLPSHSDEASSAYRRGLRAEAEKHYDAAFEAFRQAYTLKPQEPKYITSYMRARAAAASEHVSNGIVLRDKQKMQEAILEFRRASEIDVTSFVALQEIQRTEFMIKKAAEAEHAAENPAAAAPKPAPEMEGPAELEPSPNSPITLHMSTTADNVYRTIGKLSGINVLFDLDYKAQKITIDLNDILPREALRMVALESKTFWRPISSSAIFVAQESKRKEYETNVMKTFYLRNVSNPAELQEVVGTLKGLLDIKTIQVNPTHSTITLRGTPDQLALAEKLVAEVDKPKAEVIIDIEVLEVSSTRLQTLGTTVPTTASISVATAASLAASGGSAGLVSLGSVNGGSWVTAIQGGSFTFLASDTNTKILQRPQVRTLDNEKATLKIGDRVPIATGSFTPGIGAGGISPLVNTQFQYLDVGVNIDITPHIHSDHEVTLKMVLEISSVTGVSNIGGISQPTIGQRRIEHETRLEDGEINLVGGILEDSETQSLSGYPWLMRIPILKYLFGQETKQRPRTEVIFAITPHIVRAEQITEANQKLIEVGTGNTTSLRYKEDRPAKSARASASQDKTSAKNNSHPAPGAPVTAAAGRNTPQQPAGEPHSPQEH
jgi:general secretion pathway protein D